MRFNSDILSILCFYCKLQQVVVSWSEISHTFFVQDKEQLSEIITQSHEPLQMAHTTFYIFHYIVGMFKVTDIIFKTIAILQEYCAEKMKF